MFFEFVAIFDHVITHVFLNAAFSEWMCIRKMIIHLLLDPFDCPIPMMRVFLVFTNLEI